MSEQTEKLSSDFTFCRRHGRMCCQECRAAITVHVCGGQQAKRCIDGGEHDMSAVVRFKDGGSVACAKCGVTAMAIDLMELP